MAFDSREYGWGDVTVIYGGRDLTRIRGIKWSRKKEREELYAKGNDPITIQDGNNKYDVELTMTQAEFDAIEAAAGNDIFSISADIEFSFGNPLNGDAMKTHRVIGFRATEDTLELKQGDKYGEYTVPGIALRIDKNV
ncbi:hypothetical protein GCM10007424_23790 [Flavobacterium suaedae]|uniref:Phage tail protein n=1 Tax=Flavobacterium suaedae TaxID=1767027 RepID=A0ABQ1JZL9_9FLAO|nr:hypothetical protein [Flavobacterium suaedae]GGB83009.1 hypothetical protein GCM10007424_23790 [Flavobacterium suaedae]